METASKLKPSWARHDGNVLLRYLHHQDFLIFNLDIHKLIYGAAMNFPIVLIPVSPTLVPHRMAQTSSSMDMTMDSQSYGRVDELSSHLATAFHIYSRPASKQQVVMRS